MKIPSKRIRLSVYKKTLKFIEKINHENDDIYGLDSYDGLCLLLPCIWLNCHYMDQFKDESGEEFYCGNAGYYFPEFGEYYKSNSYQMNIDYRIEILKEIIAKMK